MKKESYTHNETIYVYHLCTGITIRNNGAFTKYDAYGNTTEGHSGKIEDNFVKNIRFNSKHIVSSWEE